MTLLEQAQDLVLALDKTSPAALGKLAKKHDPIAGTSELAVLISLVARLSEKALQLEADFEKPMARAKSRSVEVDHPQILEARDLLSEINNLLENDLVGEEAQDLLVSKVAKFNAAKKGLRREQVKVVYL